MCDMGMPCGKPECPWTPTEYCEITGVAKSVCSHCLEAEGGSMKHKGDSKEYLSTSDLDHEPTNPKPELGTCKSKDWTHSIDPHWRSPSCLNWQPASRQEQNKESNQHTNTEEQYPHSDKSSSE